MSAPDPFQSSPSPSLERFSSSLEGSPSSVEGLQDFLQQFQSFLLAETNPQRKRQKVEICELLKKEIARRKANGLSTRPDSDKALESAAESVTGGGSGEGAGGRERGRKRGLSNAEKKWLYERTKMMTTPDLEVIESGPASSVRFTGSRQGVKLAITKTAGACTKWGKYPEKFLKENLFRGENVEGKEGWEDGLWPASLSQNLQSLKQRTHELKAQGLTSVFDGGVDEVIDFMRNPAGSLPCDFDRSAVYKQRSKGSRKRRHSHRKEYEKENFKYDPLSPAPSFIRPPFTPHVPFSSPLRSQQLPFSPEHRKRGSSALLEPVSVLFSSPYASRTRLEEWQNVPSQASPMPPGSAEGASDCHLVVPMRSPLVPLTPEKRQRILGKYRRRFVAFKARAAYTVFEEVNWSFLLSPPDVSALL